MKAKQKEDLYTKEGQLGGAVGAVVALITGIGVAVLVMIFVGTLGGQTYNIAQADIDEIGNNVVTADGFTALAGEKVQLSFNDIQEGTLALYNSSNTIGLGNFSIDYSDGAVTLLQANATYNNTALFANYTWGANEVRTNVQQGIAESFNALEQTGSYLPLIVLAVIISLVLALVLGFAGAGGGFGGNGSAL